MVLFPWSSTKELIAGIHPSLQEEVQRPPEQLPLAPLAAASHCRGAKKGQQFPRFWQAVFWKSHGSIILVFEIYRNVMKCSCFFLVGVVSWWFPFLRNSELDVRSTFGATQWRTPQDWASLSCHIPRTSWWISGAAGRLTLRGLIRGLRAAGSF